MPSFDQHARSDAPPEQVWKLLYDPARFPQWWAGIETIEPGTDGQYTMYPAGYPDFPMPQLLRSSQHDHRVMISCLVSDLHFEWTLLPLADDGTEIRVHVQIPEHEQNRLETQQEVIRRSIANLAELAAAP
jgi:uncharacterized protein YndB with AHSA1/START domain